MLILHINYSALIVPGRFHGLAPLLDISWLILVSIQVHFQQVSLLNCNSGLVVIKVSRTVFMLVLEKAEPIVQMYPIFIWTILDLFYSFMNTSPDAYTNLHNITIGYQSTFKLIMALFNYYGKHQKQNKIYIAVVSSIHMKVL